MQERRSFLPIFALFLILSLITLFLSSHHFLLGQNLLEDITFPLQALVFKGANVPRNIVHNTELEKLQQENLSLQSQLANMQKLATDNKALRDQFETNAIPTSQLLPADIIGDPQFFPGVSAPETLIINKGNVDNVHIGDPVVYKTNIVGLITSTTDHASLITVISNKTSSFTAKTNTTEAQGVLTGQGNGVMILGSVVLSDKLQLGDTVVTSGSQNLQGKGYPPGLIVGKIVSVDKNPSSLYQSASVKSLLQVEKLTTVFVMTQQ